MYYCHLRMCTKESVCVNVEQGKLAYMETGMRSREYMRGKIPALLRKVRETHVSVRNDTTVELDHNFLHA